MAYNQIMWITEIRPYKPPWFSLISHYIPQYLYYTKIGQKSSQKPYNIRNPNKALYGAKNKGFNEQELPLKDKPHSIHI